MSRWKFYLANIAITLGTAAAIGLAVVAWNTYQRVNALWIWANEAAPKVAAIPARPTPQLLPTPRAEKGAKK